MVTIEAEKSSWREIAWYRASSPDVEGGVRGRGIQSPKIRKSAVLSSGSAKMAIVRTGATNGCVIMHFAIVDRERSDVATLHQVV